jgi:hypothetical protein
MELCNLYSSPDIIRQIISRGMRQARHVASMGKEKSVQSFGGKSEGKRPIRRPSHRWENGIKMDSSEIGWEDVEWIHQAEDRDQWQAFVNMVTGLQVLPPWS